MKTKGKKVKNEARKEEKEECGKDRLVDPLLNNRTK